MNDGADDVGPSRQANVVAAFAIMFTAATIAVGLRLYTRIKFLAGLKTEDWLILVAWIFSLGVTIGFIRQTTLALGRHVWTLSPKIIRASGMEEWYSFLLYVLSLCFTKTSILFLYRRILPPGPNRIANHVLLAVVTACNVFAVIISFAACVPLRAAWDKRVEGRCLGEVVKLGNSVLNIVTDFAIFGLPLPSVVRLRMHWRKKVGLLVVFTLGFLVCLISIIRLVTLTQVDFGDASYNLAVVAYWGAIEVNLPIICACLTTIRPLLNRLLPGLLGPGTSQYRVASHAVSSRRRDATGGSGTVAEEIRCREGGSASTSGGESLVLMLHDVEAHHGGQGVEPPPKAYGGHTGLKSDMSFSMRPEKV